jgi:hypothetical protein
MSSATAYRRPGNAVIRPTTAPLTTLPRKKAATIVSGEQAAGAWCGRMRRAHRLEETTGKPAKQPNPVLQY